MWYENNGGANPGWNGEVGANIATGVDDVRTVFVEDMDGDGDMDIVSASFNDNTIAWYENDGNADPSWTAADIASTAEGTNECLCSRHGWRWRYGYRISLFKRRYYCLVRE